MASMISSTSSCHLAKSPRHSWTVELLTTLDQPIIAPNSCGNVQQRTSPQGIGDNLARGSHPSRKGLLSEPDGHTLDWYNRPPCHEPCKGSAAFTEQIGSNTRMNSISTDQNVPVEPFAAFQQQRHSACILVEANTTSTRHESLPVRVAPTPSLRLVQVAPMHQPEGRADCRRIRRRQLPSLACAE